MNEELLLCAKYNFENLERVRPLAIVTMFISLYPRPKSWAEQSGESLKRWIDGKIK